MIRTTHPSLIKVSDTDLVVAEPDYDIQEFDVVDKHGLEIGKVNDMMIDTEEKKVRFINVASGGFLGIGEKTFLLPVDAITSIEDHKVHIDRTRHQIVGGPVYDPKMVERLDYWKSAYGYYNFGPFWSQGYIYPGIGQYIRPQ